jgi:pilus assembly protein CpaC
VNKRSFAVASLVLMLAPSSKVFASNASASVIPLASTPATKQLQAAEPHRIFIDLHASDVTEPLHLAIGRSLVLTTAAPLKRIYIGNPTVLQSYASGATEIVLTAKACGVSSLVLWDMAGQYHIYTFSSDIDSDGARAAFKSAFPDAEISVETREGKLFLTGSVPNDAALDTAMKMAFSYAKEVVSALRVVAVHGKQVQLKLRIIEVDRSKAEQFGINFFTGGSRTVLGASTQQFPSSVTTPATSGGVSTGVSVSNPLNFFLYNYKLNVGMTLEDLENKQILQVLAEPILTTLSGTPARFLSGGEFPVPVVQGGTGNSTAITIMYRPYGVKVDFTPTVNPDGTIRLKVAPEVSTLDYTNSVTISGSTIPALSTRRAETEVEIRSGESFVLSGLLDHRTTDSFANVPGIANIPILGELFRSKNINHSIVELVVLVTATVVDPLTKALDVTEPKMAVPNMDSNVFDVRVKGIVREKAPFTSTDTSLPVAKP